jgi:hypothetical protein
MTDERMNYGSFSRAFKMGEDLVPNRTNEYLEQLERSRNHGKKGHWKIDLDLALREMQMRLRDEFICVIKKVEQRRKLGI